MLHIIATSDVCFPYKLTVYSNYLYVYSVCLMGKIYWVQSAFIGKAILLTVFYGLLFV